jgi:ATP-dependent RNA helicase DDX27
LIAKACPRNRQTVLYSATMTEDVTRLVEVLMSKAVRVSVDQGVAKKLVQEFIRIRPKAQSSDSEGKEAASKGIIDAATQSQREAVLLALVKRTYTKRVLVFAPTQGLCHRLRLLLSLNGISTGELHGQLTQLQRLESLEKFRDGGVDVLVCTDLAARGLDVANIQVVINYQLPPDVDRYVHRVGRTARYESEGTSVTLVGESNRERKMLKHILKQLQPGQIAKQRSIPAPIVAKYRQLVNGCEEKVQEIMREEKEAKQLREVERSITKAENMMNHAKEIYSRPAPTYPQLKSSAAAPEDETKLKQEGDENWMLQEKHKFMAAERKKGGGMSRKQKRRRENADDVQSGALKKQKTAKRMVTKQKRSGAPAAFKNKKKSRK